MANIETPFYFDGLKKFIDLLLFETYRTPTPNGMNKYTLSPNLSNILPTYHTMFHHSIDVNATMNYFEKAVSNFMMYSSKQERRNLFHCYLSSNMRAMVVQTVTLQRKNYSFEQKYFPTNLDDKQIEFTIVELGVMPVHIFTYLTNHFSDFFSATTQEEGMISLEDYEMVIDKYLKHNSPWIILASTNTGFLRIEDDNGNIDFDTKDEENLYLIRFRQDIIRAMELKEQSGNPS